MKKETERDLGVSEADLPWFAPPAPASIEHELAPIAFQTAEFARQDYPVAPVGVVDMAWFHPAEPQASIHHELAERIEALRKDVAKVEATIARVAHALGLTPCPHCGEYGGEVRVSMEGHGDRCSLCAGGR